MSILSKGVRLDVSGLTKSYVIAEKKKTVVSDFSFSLKSYGITGLSGSTGAGKTTLIRMICGLTTPDRGSVSINDYTPRDRLYYSQFAALPDNRNLNLKLTIEENMDYLYRLKRGQKPNADDHMRYLLQSYDLLPHRDKPVSQLSRSLQLKAAIIANLFYSPSLFILDEPGLGLDDGRITSMRNTIKRLSANHMFLIASSDMLLLAEICDRIILMDEGREVEDRSIDDLIASDFNLEQSYPGCFSGEVGLVP